MFFAASTTQGDNGSSLNTLENFLGCNQVSGKGMVEMFPNRAIKTSDRGNFEFTIFMPCYHRGTRLTMLPTDTFPMSIEHDGSQARVKHGDRNGQYIYGLGISSRPDGLRRRAAPSSLSDSGAGADCRLAATTHGSSLDLVYHRQ